jgi:hypothetical protein
LVRAITRKVKEAAEKNGLRCRDCNEISEKLNSADRCEACIAANAEEQDTLCRCDNCGYECSQDELILSIQDLLQRIEPGGIVPAGECPKCKSLSYPVKKETEKLADFVRLIARMKTEEEFGEDVPPSEDWISTLNDLIAQARQIAKTC